MKLVAIWLLCAGLEVDHSIEPPLVARSIGIPPASVSGGETRPGKVTPTALVKGKKYVVDFNAPLVVDGYSADGGEVEVKQIKGPHSYSAERVISIYPSDADGVCVVPSEFIYEVTAKTSGTVFLQAFPAINRQGEDSKPIPLTTADIVRRVLAVDDGTGPRPPPTPPGPTPPGPTPPEPKPDNPLPSPNLKVLIRYDSLKTFNAETTGILNSTIATDYITSVNGEWRRVPMKEEVTRDNQWFKDAAKRTMTGTTFVVISSPRGFYEGALPTTHDEWIKAPDSSTPEIPATIRFGSENEG